MVRKSEIYTIVQMEAQEDEKKKIARRLQQMGYDADFIAKAVEDSPKEEKQDEGKG